MRLEGLDMRLEGSRSRSQEMLQVISVLDYFECGSSWTHKVLRHKFKTLSLKHHENVVQMLMGPQEAKLHLSQSGCLQGQAIEMHTGLNNEEKIYYVKGSPKTGKAQHRGQMIQSSTLAFPIFSVQPSSTLASV